MGYFIVPNDYFIKGASASGLVIDFYDQYTPGPNTAPQISLPTPGSGMMFGPNDINGNADHATIGIPEALTPIILDPAYLLPGLWREKFAGYMSDDTTYFENRSPIPNNRFGNSCFADTFGGFGSQQLPIDEAYSLQWTGYFLAPETGHYTFYTISDDCSFLWVGETAKNGQFNRSNALVDNGGAHGAMPVMASHSVSLVAGQYYHMRIQFGEAGGGESCMVFYSNSGGQNKVTDIRNKLYYDEVNTILQ